MTIQPKNNNLNYLIDPMFTNVNRLFVLPFTTTTVSDDSTQQSNQNLLHF